MVVRRVVDRKGGHPHGSGGVGTGAHLQGEAEVLAGQVHRKTGLEVACQYLGGVCGGEMAPPGGGSHENLDGNVPVEAGALRYSQRLHNTTLDTIDR